MQRIKTVSLAVTFVIAASITARAQGQAVGVVGGSPFDSTRMAALSASSQRMTRPAQFALDHKADLGLTPEQIGFLEFLAVAQRYSLTARQARMMAAMRV